MATILPFVIRPRAPVAARLSAGGAAIVIFPGVRYEPPQDGGSGARRKADGGAPRKRKDKTNQIV